MAMNTGGRLIAGSHNRNEFVLINADEIGRIKSVRELSGQICQICGDEIEITAEGEVFVACNECAFPVCRPCYEYERREGNQACPQCKTRYKRLKGSARVDGDEEEDDIDDLEHEFDCDVEALGGAGTVPSSYCHGGHAGSSGNEASTPGLEIPLLTYGEEDVEISSNHNAIILPSSASVVNGAPPYGEPSGSSQCRPMVPEKDIALYGYGSVAWKDRMEDWKKKQGDKLQVVKHQGGSIDGNDFDDTDLPMYGNGSSLYYKPKLSIDPP